MSAMKMNSKGTKMDGTKDVLMCYICNCSNKECKCKLDNDFHFMSPENLKEYQKKKNRAFRHFNEHLKNLKENGETIVEFRCGKKDNLYNLKLSPQEITNYENAVNAAKQFYDGLSLYEDNIKHALAYIKNKKIANRAKSKKGNEISVASFLTPKLEEMFCEISPRAKFRSTIAEYK